jgi:stage III sporulation protein SpoIIIAA|tara:strand:+ start:108 stop:1472 length:1365 start_codon:yes stop_codon:yes gene_type:complete
MIGNQDLDKLLEKLPGFVKKHVNQHPQKKKIIEIIMDLGRRPEARFPTGPEYLSQKIISWQDMDYIIKRINGFSNENRAGIEHTLHRISCIRNRQFLIVGLTCRIGRAVFGSICLARDLLESGKSILILGKPGVGKTTVIREMARVLSDEMEKRVIIIDTSNEIAGGSDIPHSAIGKARRMQVSQPNFQHQIMIEAVENHMPQVIIIDEIGTELEALAACAIAEKGVQLIGTTHGNCLENLVKNPSLVNLIGGIQYVTLSDEEAKRRKTQKTILERKTYPTFPIAIEINEQNSWTIHENVQVSIDSLLCEKFLITQKRKFIKGEKVIVRYDRSQTNHLTKKLEPNQLPKSLVNTTWNIQNISSNLHFTDLQHKKIRVYLYSLSHNLIREVLSKLDLCVTLTKDVRKANVIIGLRSNLQQNQKLQKLAREKNIPIYKVTRNTVYQVVKLIQFIML